jgi:hypothetical protein
LPQSTEYLQEVATVHPEDGDVWYWLIAFADGRCSLGVIGAPEFLNGDGGDLPSD